MGVDRISNDGAKDKFLFFYDSLIDVFQPETSHLWAFSVRHGTELLYQYFNKPLYQSSEQALRAAKLHALINFCERSHQLHWLTLYPEDRILTQSEEVIAQFGETTNLLAIDLYYYKQARVDFLQRVSLNGLASSSPKKLLGWDGKIFDGVITAHLIRLATDTTILLENFEQV